MPFHDEFLVVVEPTSSNTEILEKLNELQTPTIVLTPFKNDIQEIRNNLNNPQVIVIENYNIDDWIRDLPAFDKIGGVGPGNELAVERASKLAERINKGNYSVHETAVVCRYKDKMRLCLENAGIANPKFEIITSKDQAIQAANRIGYPCVVKPTDQAASYGVKMVNSDEELSKAVDFVYNHRLYEDAYGFENAIMPKREEVLIEEAISGQEFSVEMFSRRGEILFKAVTEKETTHSPNFIEIAHSVPPIKYGYLQDEILDFAKHVITALGIKEGISHCEVMLTDEGFKVIECANRIPGDQILELHRSSYGVDIAKAVIDNALGKEIKLEPFFSNCTVIKYLFFDQVGTIQHLGFNNDDIKKMNGVIKHHFKLKEGKQVKALSSFFDRQGYVICKGETPEDANKNCDSVITFIKSNTRIG